MAVGGPFDPSECMTPLTGNAARIAAFLDSHRVMALATSGPYGPHAANLFYARDGFCLLWVSDRNSRHSAALEANPHVAATVAPDCRDFDEVCGVQIAGDAHRITDAPARRRARDMLEARYPLLQRLSERPAIKQAYESAELYRLVPRTVVMIDNARGFGHKEALDFPISE